MAQGYSTTFISDNTACATCGKCCGGACANNFIACRGVCYPCCEEAVLFAANVEIPAGTPVGPNAELYYDIYDPAVNNGVVEPHGITKHPVKTDDNHKLIQFRPTFALIPGCGLDMGVIYTSGEYAEKQIAAGQDNQAQIVAAILAYPSFAKRVPNGYIRIL